MKLKIRFLILSIFLFISIGTLILLIYVNSIDKQTTDNTKLYQATISEIKVNSNIAIYTKENESYLSIPKVISENLSTEQIKLLQENKKISFRILSTHDDLFNETSFVQIASLYVDDICIFSLSNYNELNASASYPAKITAIVMSILFFILFIILLRNTIHRKNIITQ